ncbi:hypothetical protein IFR05_007757 [Cadophora sp. M221]|nr:hypothetical protein IFR05_007757 [Cadophora sp. M221]
MVSLRFFLSLGLLSVIVQGVTLPIFPTVAPVEFQHNATLHRRNNINKYGGCGKMYGTSSGKDLVNRAYKDMLKIAQVVNPFLRQTPPCASCAPPEVAPGVLEDRFFADLKGKDARQKLIRETFANSANWYPWFFFDWIKGGRIEVYCEVEQRTLKNYRCDKVIDGKKLTAYVSNLEGKSKIVFCPPFFTMASLDQVKRDLTQFPLTQKVLPWAKNSGQAFFHEMTHLSIIEGLKKTDDNFITDNPTNPEAEKPDQGPLVYGAKATEILARDWPAYAYKNADNYACIASTSTAPADDFSDLFEDDRSDPEPVDYESIDYDEISSDEQIAFDAGDYTPNGWLQNKKLRILPLGDSITNGFQSSDGNGYRGELVNILTGAGNTVDMVGSLRAGVMADSDNEGHNGATIAQISTFTAAYGQRPNIILLHAGTNDLNIPSQPAGAPGRLDALVGQLLAACPDATIIVARVVPSTNGGTSTLIPQFNNAITDLMSARAQNGQHVMIVDMPSAVSTGNLADGLHPNNEGYKRMALKWAIAITAIDSLGWVRDPVKGSGSGTSIACAHDPVWIAQGQIANGAGLGANLWLTANCTLNAASRLCDCDPTSALPLTQALLDSTKQCDLSELVFPFATAVHFADLNGDGRAEYLHVNGVGAVTAFLNLGGPDQGPNAAKISWLPQGVIATGVGANRGNVQFADINGDGRAEYLWVHDDGSVDCWLNGGGPDNGPNAGKVTWFPQGRIAPSIGKDGRGVRFADLNGDGRAEYLYVNTDGSVEAYLNLGSDSGANPGQVSWLSQGKIATGVGQGRDNVVFADINGDGRADYLAVSRTDGSTVAYINGGGPDDKFNAAKVVWYPHGTIGTGVGSNGKGVQFADLNGDGRAEFIDVDFATSAANAWLNGC